METKLKNIDLVVIRDGLQPLRTIEADVEFPLFIIRALHAINTEIKQLVEAIPQTPDYKEVYVPRVQELAAKYCTKDENGNTQITKDVNGNEQYHFDDEKNKQKYLKEVQKLEDDPQIKKILEAKKKEITKRQEIEQKEVAIELPTIDRKYLPKSISAELLEPIYPLIKQD